MHHVGNYFMKSDRPDGLPNDPVARFHLGNGASLEQVNLQIYLKLDLKGLMVLWLIIFMILIKLKKIMSC